MAKSNDLFDLIKSLSKAEKRKFKMEVQNGNEEQKYLKLFEAIDKVQSKEEMEALEKKLKGEVFLNQLNPTKNYLRKRILEVLRGLGKNKIEALVQSDILNIKILIGKRLIKQANKTLKQAKKRAQSYELLTSLYELLLLEIEIALEMKSKTMKTDVVRLYKEAFDIFNNLKEELGYRELDHSVFVAYRMGIRNGHKEAPNLYSAVESRDEFKKEPSSDFFYPNFLNINIKAFYYHLKDDYSSANQYYKKAVKIWKENELMQQRDPRKYRIVLFNYLQNCHKIQDYSEFDTYIEEIEKLNGKNLNKNEAGEIFQTVSQLKLLKYMNKGEFKEAKKDLIPDIIEGMVKHDSKLNESSKMTLWSNMSVVYLALGDYKALSEISEQVLKNANIKIRRDLLFPQFVLRIIALFEQEDGEDALTAFKLGKPKFKRKNANAFEKCIWKHFPKWLNAPTFDQKAVLQLIEADLAEQTQAVSAPFGVFEVYTYVRSKLRRKTFQDILREDEKEKKLK